ncbi:MAG: hypothetical protein QOG91_579 [Candidatus Parcubacteria bacterium]|nr:hypothetical protein [Candidatus Parcubacteria bacterium]
MTMRSSPRRGFTLVELLVTISIFIFMTALILARYNGFNSGTLLTNLAYDVALTIRTAQSYGVSVVASGAKFNTAYGVSFKSTITNQSSFKLFADGSASTPNGYLDSGDDVVSTYNLKQGAKISKLCGGTGSTCDPGNSLQRLDITYKRPDPNAIIYGATDAGLPTTPYTYAEITVTSGDNSSSRVVKVNEFGLISVGN